MPTGCGGRIDELFNVVFVLSGPVVLVVLSLVAAPYVVHRRLRAEFRLVLLHQTGSDRSQIERDNVARQHSADDLSGYIADFVPLPPSRECTSRPVIGIIGEVDGGLVAIPGVP